jgi:CHAT domain-containing protein/Tfp pilus assembly protein PilF
MRRIVIKRTFPLRISFAVLALTLSAHVTAGQKPQAGDVHELTSGQVVEREMSGAEAHLYKFTLAAAGFMQVRVEQKGVDVLLRLLDAGGVELARMDSPNGKVGPEILSFVATAAGGYTLEVSSLDEKAEKGAYTVRRTESRAATALDRRRVEVERAFVEGMTARDTAGQQATALVKLSEALAGWRELSDEYLLQLTQGQVRAVELAGRKAKAQAVFAEARKLEKEGTAESKREALARFERSRDLYREIGDEAGQANCLLRLGFIHGSLGEQQKALDFYNRALPLKRAVGDRAGEATTLNNIGLAYSALGEKQKALEFYNQALPLRRAVGDRAGETIVLINIGAVYSNLGEKQKALEFYNQALPLTRAVGDRAVEATTLGNIGAVYSALGEQQKALEFHNRALPLRRAVGDRAGEATTLNNIGFAYSALGEKQKALEFYNQALPLARVVGDRAVEATTLNNIGNVYNSLGEKQKALEFFSQTLLLRRAVGDRAGEAATLGNIGDVYYSLGQKQKALDFSYQALPLRRAVGDRAGEATTLNNIGAIYDNLGEKPKALEFFDQALSLRRAVGDRAGEATTLSNIGRVYNTLGEQQKALDFFYQALPLKRAVGDRAGESITLSNIGSIYSALGEKQKALEFYNQALPLKRAVGDRAGEATTLNHMMRVWDYLKRPRLAIYYGKQSVNRYQELRRAIQGLDKETQQNFLKTVQGAYQRLADILIVEGRFAEAQQVLALLKEEEYFEYVRRDADEIKNLGGRVSLAPDEQKLIARYNLLADRVTSLGAEFQMLDHRKRRSEGALLPPAEQKRYDELDAQLKDANAAFRLFLEKELVAEFAKLPVKREIDLDRALQEKLRRWGPGTVALYTLVGEERYRVILTTPTVQVDGKFEIKAADLNKKIFAFREALQKPGADPRPLSKELYDILVKPVEKDLQAAGAKTLIWSLSGALRYVPLAALSPDGQTYLIQKYQSVVITSATRQSLSAPPKRDWRALGLGVTAAHTVADPTAANGEISFEALPGARSELAAIVRDEQAGDARGLFAGRRFLDADFNEKNFADHLTREAADGGRRYSVVHIASHFRLGGSTADSFILLGDGSTLTLEQISNSPRMTFGDVELVTLSACNTAFGSGGDATGQEVDSLATFIELRGAKAIMATLWSVADESTGALMTEFYRLRKETPRLTKAAALQRAQRAMIEGGLTRGGGRRAQRAELVGRNAATKTGNESAKKYAHPYYWAPFILIGNWR